MPLWYTQPQQLSRPGERKKKKMGGLGGPVAHAKSSSSGAGSVGETDQWKRDLTLIS